MYNSSPNLKIVPMIPKTAISIRNETPANNPTNGMPIKLKVLSKDVKFVYKTIQLQKSSPNVGETQTDVRNCSSNISPKIRIPISSPTATTTASVNALEYRELFAALLKIKDTALVARIMAVINGASQPETSISFCSNCVKTEAGVITRGSTVSNGTQTLESDFRKSHAMTDPMVKRSQQRKRKRCIPHAVQTASPLVGGFDGAASPSIKRIAIDGSDAVKMPVS